MSRTGDLPTNPKQVSSHGIGSEMRMLRQLSGSGADLGTAG